MSRIYFAPFQTLFHFPLLVSGQTVVHVMLHLIIEFEESALFGRRNFESFVDAMRGFHQFRRDRRLKLLLANSNIANG